MEYIIIGGFLVFLFLGVPLYTFLFALSAYLFFQGDVAILSTVVSFQKLQSQEFISAIPLFTFAGYLLSRSESPARIVHLTKTCFSFVPAASSIVVIFLMALFTALTGASGVSILALGGLMYPVLKESSEESFAHGLITGAGSIGLLFAPSLPVIIYTIIANQNAGKYYQIEIDALFRVAIIPSMILIGTFVVNRIVRQKKKPLFFQGSKAWEAIKSAKWEIPLPVIVYGGIYSGLFTVLEAGVITAGYTFFIVFVVNRDLKISTDFVKNTVDSLKLSGNIFIIMATAFILTNYIVNEQIPERIFSIISPYIQNKYVFLLAINILLLITGCLLDIFSAILIVLPLLIPIVEKYGIDPYHFAIIFLVNLEIGYITPPVGLNLFISSFSFKKSITYLYRATLPFLFLMIGALMVLTYIPSITTAFRPAQDQGLDIRPPNKVESLVVKPVKLESGSAGIRINFPASEDTGGSDKLATSYKVYYLDEEESDSTIIADFGEIKGFFTDEFIKTDNNRVTLELDVEAGGTYSLVVVAVDTSNNESTVSEIVIVEVP